MLRTLTLALFLSVLTGCSGEDRPEASTAENTPETANPGPPWTAFQDQGALFVKADRSAGLVQDAAVTVLGAPVAGTTNRRIIGFGNVAEVWDDMVRIELTHLDSSAAGQGMVARRPEKSDLDVVAGLPRT